MAFMIILFKGEIWVYCQKKFHIINNRSAAIFLAQTFVATKLTCQVSVLTNLNKPVKRLESSSTI